MAKHQAREVHACRGTEGEPRPGPGIDIEQREAPIARIALELDFDQAFEAETAEEAPRGIDDGGLLDRLDEGRGVAELQRILATPPSRQFAERLTVDPVGGVGPLVLSAARDQLLEHDGLRSDQGRGLGMKADQRFPIVGTPRLGAGQAVRHEPHRRLQHHGKGEVQRLELRPVRDGEGSWMVEAERARAGIEPGLVAQDAERLPAGQRQMIVFGKALDGGRYAVHVGVAARHQHPAVEPPPLREVDEPVDRPWRRGARPASNRSDIAREARQRMVGRDRQDRDTSPTEATGQGQGPMRTAENHHSRPISAGGRSSDHECLGVHGWSLRQSADGGR
jgi:hypothetical protein